MNSQPFSTVSLKELLERLAGISSVPVFTSLKRGENERMRLNGNAINSLNSERAPGHGPSQLALIGKSVCNSSRRRSR
jgi:hypothetical protein